MFFRTETEPKFSARVLDFNRISHVSAFHGTGGDTAHEEFARDEVDDHGTSPVSTHAAMLTLYLHPRPS